MSMRVASVERYPLKGAGGEKLEVAEVIQEGISGDHIWAIGRQMVDTASRYTLLDQKTLPNLALVHARLMNNWFVSVDYPLNDADRVGHTLPTRNMSTVGVNIFDERALGAKIEPSSMSWLYRGPESLGQFVGLLPDDRLIAYDGSIKRVLDTDFIDSAEVWGRAAFQGACPFHIISNQTIQELSNRSVQFGQPELDASRWRANIVIDAESPFTEDALVGKKIQIGSVVMRVYRRASRCPIPTINQKTGQIDVRMGQLYKSRMLPTEHSAKLKPMVGVYAVHENPGTFELGDSLHIL